MANLIQPAAPSNMSGAVETPQDDTTNITDSSSDANLIPGGGYTTPNNNTPSSPGIPPPATGQVPPVLYNSFSPVGPGGAPVGNGGPGPGNGVSPAAPSGIPAGDANDPNAALQALLAGGMDPNDAVNQINSEYGLQTGSSYAWEPGSDTIAVPGGAEYFEDSTGTWGPVFKTPETGGTAGSGTDPNADVMAELQQIFGPGASQSPTPSQDNPDLTNYLNGILTDPSSLINQGLINSETMNARDQEEQAKNTTTQSLEAQLGARGLAGGGAETTGLENLDAQLDNTYGNAVTSINQNAAGLANQDLLSTIQAATGLSEADASNLINQYQATTARGGTVTGASNSAESILDQYLLGEGGLGLQSNAQDMTAQEFQDTFGLNQQAQNFNEQNTTSTDFQNFLNWFNSLSSGSNSGFVG